MTTYYYAMEWAYGPATDTYNGKPIGWYYRFTSRAARGAWIADGNPDATARGARSALRANDYTRQRAAEDERERDELAAEMAADPGVDAFAAARAY